MFTDWLDPGVTSKSLALMIVPWLLYCCLTWRRTRECRGYSSLPSSFSSTLIAASRWYRSSVSASRSSSSLANGRGGLRRTWAGLSSWRLPTFLVLPLLLAEYRFLRIRPANQERQSFTVLNGFVNFWHYIYDGSHRWYSPAQLPPLQNFVQIDFAILDPNSTDLPSSLRDSALLRSRQNKDRTLEDHVTLDPRHRVLWFLVVCLALYLFLQLRVSYFVYRLLPPLQVINFPWRMLALITPPSVVLLEALAV